jgi:hypothetical protein
MYGQLIYIPFHLVFIPRPKEKIHTATCVENSEYYLYIVYIQFPKKHILTHRILFLKKSVGSGLKSLGGKNAKKTF